jgi:large subunit ribosomal protein L6
MSRIGRRIIDVPDGVTIEAAPGRVTVTGPRGALEQVISPDMTLDQDGGTLTVTRPSDRSEHRRCTG